jgi:hypothetical protein
MAGHSRSALLIVVTALVVVGAAAAADTWPKNEPNAADQALAKKSVLHLSDFTPGSGWTADPKGAASISGSGSNSDSCQVDDRGKVVTGTASTSFKAPGFQVWSMADVMQTAAMVSLDVKQASNPALIACIRATLARGMPKGTQFISLKKLAFPTVGEWTMAYRALVDVSVNATKIRLQLDIVFVQNKRVEITLMQMAPFAVSALAKAAEVRLVERLSGSSLVA